MLGLGSIGYLAVAGRALGPDRFGVVALFWILLNTLGPGLFLPLEQELARAIVSRRSSGRGASDIVGRAATLAVCVLLILYAAAAVASDQFVDLLLGGSHILLIILAAGAAAMALSYGARGVLAGTGQWGRYGTQLGMDGLLRFAGALLLLTAGTQQPAAYCIVLVVSLIGSTALILCHPSRLVGGGSGGTWSELGEALGWLLIASAGGLLLQNSAPLALEVLVPADDAAATGNFIAALVVARVPLFFFAGVSAALLPSLSVAVNQANRTLFCRAIRRLLCSIAGIGLIGVLTCSIAGPQALRLLFGSDFGADRVDVVLLAVSTAGLMVVATLSQATVAAQRYTTTAVAPLWGLAAFVAGCLVLDLQPSTKVAAALVLGVGAAATVLAVSMRRYLREWSVLGAS